MASDNNPGSAGAYQIMLSYRVSETGAADKGGDGTTANIRAFLEASGYTVFQDVMFLTGGDDFISVLNSAVTGCAVFMPVISPTYGDMKRSQWCVLPSFLPFYATSCALNSLDCTGRIALLPETAFAPGKSPRGRQS